MNVMPEIAEAHSKLTEWRRDLHRHPELAFEEHRTSADVRCSSNANSGCLWSCLLYTSDAADE